MKYYKQIDGLRFVAIFFVLVQHFAAIFGTSITAGYYGVDLFFVISGFLITSILLNQTGSFGSSYSKFLGRRALRIFPLYYLAIFTLYFLPPHLVKDYFIFFVTYTYNYAYVYFKLPATRVTHFWSLCVEEQFYLLWPLITLSLRQKRAALYVGVILLIVLSFAQTGFNIFPSVTPYNRVGVFPRGGSLCMGALGALLYKDDLLKNKILQTQWVEYIVFVLLVLSLVYIYPLKYFVLSLSSLFLIIKCTGKGFKTRLINSFLNNRQIIYLGTISYSIYIFHLPVSYYIYQYIITPAFEQAFYHALPGPFSVKHYTFMLMAFLVNSLVSIGLAYCSYKFIEKPILRYKDKFFKYQD